MANPNSNLGRALEEARSALGSPSDVQRLRDKLGELPPENAPIASAASTSLGLKIAAGTVAGALLIAGAMLMGTDRKTEVTPRTRMPAPLAVPTPLPVPAPVVVPDAPSALVAPALEPEPPTAREVQRRKTAKSSTAPVIKAPLAPAPTAGGPKELELLMTAQDAIEVSLQRALGLLEDHARLYPNGNFAQERESLAIDALRKLGRITEAQQRARAFIARFPKASNVKHLTRWLEEHKTETQPLPTP